MVAALEHGAQSPVLHVQGSGDTEAQLGLAVTQDAPVGTGAGQTGGRVDQDLALGVALIGTTGNSADGVSSHHTVADVT